MATKDELKSELDALGVEYPANANKDELEKLLADNQPEEESEDEESEDEESEEETEDEETDEESEEDEESESEEEFEDAAEVREYGVYRGNNLVTKYTLLNHGDDFVKLAKEKAKTIPGAEARPFVDPARPVIEKTSVAVVNQNGNEVRRYSKSVHGNDYLKLADAFIEKHGEKKGYRLQK